MPSPAMQNLIDAFRDRRAATTGQAPPTLDELRAGFAPQVVSTRCLTTALQGAAKARRHAIFAAQSARVVVTRWYPNGSCRRADTQIPEQRRSCLVPWRRYAPGHHAHYRLRPLYPVGEQ